MSKKLSSATRLILASFALSSASAWGQERFNSILPPNGTPYGSGHAAFAPAGQAPVAPPRADAIDSSAPPSAGEPLTLENVGSDYKLRRGDSLSYQVKEDRDPATMLQVTDSGELLPPYLGHGIPAVGKTVGQMESDIRSALERDLYVHASVQIGLVRVAPHASKGRVYMTGQIHNIGPIELPADEVLTVSRAILRAGGFTAFGDDRHVIILRKDGPPTGIKVDVKAFLAGKSHNDPEVKPGDTILVKEKLINISF